MRDLVKFTRYVTWVVVVIASMLAMLAALSVMFWAPPLILDYGFGVQVQSAFWAYGAPAIIVAMVLALWALFMIGFELARQLYPK